MKKLIGVVLVGLFLFIGISVNSETVSQKSIRELLGIDGQYDTHSVLVGMAGLEKLEMIIKSLPIVEVALKIQTMPNMAGVPEGMESEIIQRAVGILLGDRYLLTVVHATIGGNIDFKTPFGTAKVMTHTVWAKYACVIAGEKFELRPPMVRFYCHEQDWVLFELPTGALGKQYPVKIGKSDELKPGHFLYLVGSPSNIAMLVRNGIVEATRVDDIKTVLPKVNPDDAFALSGGIYPGDSGGPVFAVRDGQLELVGIINSGVVTAVTIGYALKITPLFEKIKAATGIDLAK